MERLAASPSFVGIDVSKDRLDVNVRPSGQYARHIERHSGRFRGRA
jgi:hypothetical protein